MPVGTRLCLFRRFLLFGLCKPGCQLDTLVFVPCFWPPKKFFEFFKKISSLLGLECCSRGGERVTRPFMHLENRIPIHQVHQFRCAKARATAAGYAITPVYRAQRETPLRVSGCPRYGDDSRNDNGTPVQSQSQAIGTALSERQLG